MKQFISILLVFLGPFTALSQLSEERQLYLDSLYDVGHRLISKSLDSSLHISKIYLDSAKKWNDSLEMGYASDLYGLSLYYKNQLDEAEANFLFAIRMFKKHEDELNLADAYSNLAGVHSDRGQYHLAIDLYLKCLEIYQDQNDEINPAYILSDMAIVFFDQENYLESEKYITQSLEIGEKNELAALNGINYNLLGEIEIKRKNFIQASVLSQKAYEIAVEEDDIMEMAFSQNNFGLIEIERGNFSEGIRLMEIAIKNAQEYGDPYSIGMYQTYLAEAYLKAGDDKQALIQANEAHATINSTASSRYLKREIFRVLSGIYRKLSRFKEALEFHQKFKAISDTISKQNVLENVLLLKNQQQLKQNESLKKSNKIQKEVSIRNWYLMIGALALLVISILLIFVLISNRNRKIKYLESISEKNSIIENKDQAIEDQNKTLIQKNIELNELNDANNKLFAILTHDIKEPFNQILNLLELIDYDALSEEEKLEMIESLKDSVCETRETVENLLHWSKSQFSSIDPEPEVFDLLALVDDVQLNLKSLFKHKSVTLQINVAKESLVHSDYGQTLIAVRNILVNAIKFSHTNGSVFVNSEINEKEVILSIKDEGVGISEERLREFQDFGKIMSTQGTFKEKGTGLGILIVTDLLERNKGSLTIYSAVGEGSTFNLHLPKA